jgi:hypothetical protein
MATKTAASPAASPSKGLTASSGNGPREPTPEILPGGKNRHNVVLSKVSVRMRVRMGVRVRV